MRQENNTRRMKLVFLIIISATLIALVTVFADFRHREPKTEPALSEGNPEATLSLCTIRQVATRNGQMDWSLNAQSAQYYNDRNEADFTNPSVTFFLDTQEKVHLSAREGTVRTDTNDMEVHGSVVIRNNDFELKTESLRYDNQKRTFFSDRTVVLTSPRGDITADGASYATETGLAIFTGNIQGTFKSGFKL